jgi:hypothetical protein
MAAILLATNATLVSCAKAGTEMCRTEWLNVICVRLFISLQYLRRIFNCMRSKITLAIINLKVCALSPAL